MQWAAKLGNPGAMLTLAQLLLRNQNVEMAKMWFDRACEAGNMVAQMNRDTFGKMIAEQQKLMCHFSSDVLRTINEVKNIANSLKTSTTASTLSTDSDLYDYNLLKEHANRGSKTAQKLCDASDHFAQALNILTQSETLTEDQENTFVHELSQCYRTEDIAAQIPGVEIRQKIEAIVDRVLHRCSVGTSQLNEDARVCYATLHMDSNKLIIEFLNSCKQKYPEANYFFELSVAANSFSGRYEDALYDANVGLERDPNNCELLCDRAVALRLIDNDTDEAIEAYRKFLSVAPNDHRKVPDAYYSMASCYFARNRSHNSIDSVNEAYKRGEEAEKMQLPCFLPYDSTSKTLLKSIVYPESPSIINQKSRLTDPHRIELITQHRDWQSKTSLDKNNPIRAVFPYTREPRVKQQTAKSLIGLKPTTLREINPTKDHVYDGYVLPVTIIEEAYSWVPSIHLMIEDEHLDCERLYIYNFPKGQGEYFTSKVFTIGSKMHISNPYLRIGANDMRASIRIDDFSSIIMRSESEWVINMCRCCGEANAPHVCSKCKQARYCTRECQTMDWKTYKHKLICQSQ